jgi:hypothetical protein
VPIYIYQCLLKLFIFHGFTYSMNLSIIVLFSGYIYQITLHNIYRIDKMDLPNCI